MIRITLAIIFCYEILTCQGANILIVHPLNLRGQSSFLRPLAHALAQRNHSVTVVSGERGAFNESLVEVIPVWNLTGLVEMSWENSKAHFMSDVFRARHFTSNNIRIVLDSEHIQRGLLASSSNRSFDAVISNSFLFFQSLAAIPHRFNALAIEFIPQADNPISSVWSGNIIPSVKRQTGESASNYFIERTKYFWKIALLLMYNRLIIIPDHQSIIDDTCRFNSETRPPLYKLLSKKSVILSHSHPSLFPQESVSLYQKHVAGISIRKREPIPKSFEDFIGGSDFGFILLSWGTLTSSSDGHQGDLILDAMSRINKRVIWKTSRTNFSKPIPENVMLSSWVPQENLLGDQRIKLFLTHGGFSSMVEAIHYGVPVVVTPSSFDQPANAAQMVSNGMGLILPFDKISTESLFETINEVIENPKYKIAAKVLSEKFRNRLVSPLFEATFWIENALKFKTVVPSDQNYILTLFLIANSDILFVTIVSLMTSIIFVCVIFCRVKRCLVGIYEKTKNE